MSKDPSSVFFENYNVLDRSLILKHCPLSTKSDFWAELEQQKALHNTEIHLIIEDKSVLSEEARQAFDQLKPYENVDPTDARILVRYSSETNVGTVYKLQDAENLSGNRQKFKDEMNRLIDKGSVKLDKMATVLIVPGDISYFTAFDGVTTDDLKEFFHLTDHGAGWILNMLRSNGILQLQSVQMIRLTTNEETWKKLVRMHLEKNAKKPEKEDPIEVQLLFGNAGVLQQLRDNRKLLNVTEEVIASCLQVPPGVNETEMAKKFYTYLTEKQLLESYVYNIWRLDSKLDCSALPACIADHIDEFLSDRFAYSFALEKLCLSLQAATKDPQPSPHEIFLPENPFVEVFEDFANCGLAMPERLCTSPGSIDDFDYEDFQHAETIKSVLYSNRLKLYDQTDYHMELTPFSTYIVDQGFMVDSDLRAMMNNGLKVVVTRRREKAGQWLLNQVIAAGAWCWNTIKSAASAVASFCYSVVQFVVQGGGKHLNMRYVLYCKIFLVKLFKAAVDYVAPYVKEAGQLILRIAQPLLDTAVGKAVVATMQVAKEVVVEAAYQGLGAAEWVINKGTQAVTWTGKKATAVVKWIGDTRVVKGTVGLVKDFGAWVASTDVWKAAAELATYVYTKMSSFCTAVSESYQYYNQCRTAARRLTIEKRGLVDEHAILRTFHGVSQQETKKASENNAAEEVSFK